jgi:hypothetical protein
MNTFLFYFNLRNLPVYSTFFDISNLKLLTITGFIQLLISLIFTFYHNVIAFFSLFTALLLLTTCIIKKSALGYTTYYIQLICIIIISLFWSYRVIRGLDFTIHDFKNGEYKKVVKEIISDYIFTGFLAIFSILSLLFLLTYSNELKFEEVKEREEKRSELEDDTDTEADSFNHKRL